MIPVDVVFMRFPRLVRDLSTKLGKEVELDLVGRETELDRTVVDALGDPLVHLVRNSLDHGIEPPEDREAAGKPRVGTLTIAARHAGGSVVIEVRDDGRGSRSRADRAQGAGKRTDRRGSGRASSTCAARSSCCSRPASRRPTRPRRLRPRRRDGCRPREDPRASAARSSSSRLWARAPRAQIRLPLTLAIVSALQVDVAGAPFAIPLDRIAAHDPALRADRPPGRRPATCSCSRTASSRCSMVPRCSDASRRASTVRRRDRPRRTTAGSALAVDDLVGQRELVTRPLPPIVADGQPVSGGAALADGQIALIVDCDLLAASVLSGISWG